MNGRLWDSLNQRTRTRAGGVREDVTSQVLGAAQIRAQHRGLLLRLIWRERLISRADLARRTGLSRSSISAIVADLLATGLVRETGAGDSSGGRRPILLGFMLLTLALSALAVAVALAGNGAALALGLIGVAGFGARLYWEWRQVDPEDNPLCLALFRDNRNAGLILFAGLAAAALV